MSHVNDLLDFCLDADEEIETDDEATLNWIAEPQGSGVRGG
jgi:hypothetical protein